MRPLLALLILAACGTAESPIPTPDHPFIACAISCPWGFSSRAQHLCRSERRWFQRILVKGEYTIRGADGEKLVDVWITDQGDFAKVDVVRGSCESFQQSQCAANVEHPCAAHPGEPDPFHP